MLVAVLPEPRSTPDVRPRSNLEKADSGDSDFSRQMKAEHFAQGSRKSDDTVREPFTSDNQDLNDEAMGENAGIARERPGRFHLRAARLDEGSPDAFAVANQIQNQQFATDIYQGPLLVRTQSSTAEGNASSLGLRTFSNESNTFGAYTQPNVQTSDITIDSGTPGSDNHPFLLLSALDLAPSNNGPTSEQPNRVLDGQIAFLNSHHDIAPPLRGTSLSNSTQYLDPVRLNVAIDSQVIYCGDARIDAEDVASELDVPNPLSTAKAGPAIDPATFSSASNSIQFVQTSQGKSGSFSDFEPVVERYEPQLDFSSLTREAATELFSISRNIDSTPAPRQSSIIGTAAAQVAATISTNANRDEVQINLDPPELGALHIRMTFGENGALVAQLSFDNDTTRQLMKANDADLRAALADAGFPDAQLEYSNGGRRDAQTGEGSAPVSEHIAIAAGSDVHSLNSPPLARRKTVTIFTDQSGVDIRA
ncbi:MAG: hypothetical protein GC152_14025 [Alphaproteobacteria bacterium]|nr:hypothetical protein [Alphaproteobacteria bacterium]